MNQCSHGAFIYSSKNMRNGQYTTRRCFQCGSVSEMKWSPWRNPVKEDIENMPLKVDYVPVTLALESRTKSNRLKTS